MRALGTPACLGTLYSCRKIALSIQRRMGAFIKYSAFMCEVFAICGSSFGKYTIYTTSYDIIYNMWFHVNFHILNVVWLSAQAKNLSALILDYKLTLSDIGWFAPLNFLWCRHLLLLLEVISAWKTNREVITSLVNEALFNLFSYHIWSDLKMFSNGGIRISEYICIIQVSSRCLIILCSKNS